MRGENIHRYQCAGLLGGYTRKARTSSSLAEGLLIPFFYLETTVKRDSCITTFGEYFVLTPTRRARVFALFSLWDPCGRRAEDALSSSWLHVQREWCLAHRGSVALPLQKSSPERVILQNSTMGSALSLRSNTSELSVPRRLERIQETPIEMGKVGDIAGYEGQFVDNGRCRNHGVLV